MDKLFCTHLLYVALDRRFARFYLGYNRDAIRAHIYVFIFVSVFRPSLLADLEFFTLERNAATDPSRS